MAIDFFTNGLCTHCNDAAGTFYGLEQFHDETEANWAINEARLQSQLDEELSTHPEGHHEDIVDGYIPDIQNAQYMYPAIHRKSLVITLFSQFENQLNELCIILEPCIETKVRLMNLHGKGIERAYLYLEKVAGFDLSSMGKERPFIKGANAIRNCIVHSAGKLPAEDKNKTNEFVSRTDSLSRSFGGTVVIHPSFIGEFISMLTSFFDKLGAEVQKFIQQKSLS